MTISILALAAGIATASGAAAAVNECQLNRVAEWPVRLERNELVVAGTINRQPVNVKLDTGATRTMLLRSTALKLGVTLHRTRARIYGIGGEADLEVAWIDDFGIGETKRENWQMLVAAGRERNDGVGLLLGEDFLQKFDVEFDLAHRTVRLYQPEHCEAASLAYWAAEGVSAVDLDTAEAGGPRIIFTVHVNGHPVHALLDSGAESSLLNKSDAAAAGITPETPGVVLIGNIGGVGRKSLATWLGPFHSIAIGNELIKDSVLPFADLYRYATYTPNGGYVTSRVDALAPMLLGVDFLRTHRVLVAHSQRRIYFSYGGGPVFMWAGAQRGAPPQSPKEE